MKRGARSSSRGPLQSVRIIDFTQVVVGPWTARIPAGFAAEVIKVERLDDYDTSRFSVGFRKDSYRRQRASGAAPAADSPNQGGLFNNINANKLGVTLNCRHPDGLALIEQLICVSDAVVENFSAGVLESWGLGWERLHTLNPRLVYLSITGYGHSGPLQHYRSYGQTSQAFSGLTFCSGQPGQPPAGWGFSYMDVMGGFIGSLGLTLGLYRARQIGEGCYIDYSVIEGAMSLLGPMFLDFEVNGRATRRRDFPPGNHSLFPPLAPHNTYRCAGVDRLGQDQWCFIACETQVQFEALCALMNRTDLLFDPRFTTIAARVQHQVELDAIITTWTECRARYEVMDACQRAGIIAASVQTGEDRIEYDPQLRHRDLYPVLDHPETGPYKAEAYPPKLRRNPATLRRGGPLWREHNSYVFGDLLGLSEQEQARLSEAGVI